ncbi:MAG: acyl-CoA desaturase [Candidatus Andersenbacteria bacterium]|nr:acyl-CoA desaturase [Candidatus Andersenbacteria bacterium]
MRKLNGKITSGLALVHVLGLAGAYFFWSWEGFLLLMLLYPLTALGVTIGFHRYLTHGGFKTYRCVRWVLAVIGMLSGEGPPIYWVSTHRKHHQFSDIAGDPHSPTLEGFWHAHVLWLLAFARSKEFSEMFIKFVPDLLRERFMLFLNRSYLWWHLGLLAILAGSGFLYGGWYYLCSFIAYGFFARMVVVLNVTWAVNSFSHMWGYRLYETADDSRNNWLVALLAYGEGWHNNHHAHPSLARHGHRWWEVDTSYWIIRVMQFLHIVWDVKATLPQR